MNAAKNHTTALHIAANNDSVNMAALLLEFGANIYAENLWGKRPKHLVEDQHGKESSLYHLLSSKEGMRMQCSSVIKC